MFVSPFPPPPFLISTFTDHILLSLPKCLDPGYNLEGSKVFSEGVKYGVKYGSDLKRNAPCLQIFVTASAYQSCVHGIHNPCQSLSATD